MVRYLTRIERMVKIREKCLDRVATESFHIMSMLRSLPRNRLAGHVHHINTLCKFCESNDVKRNDSYGFMQS